MAIRTKVILTVILSIVGMAAVFYMIASRVVLGGFERIGDNIIRNDVQRVQNALQDELTDIGQTGGDWAPWNETRDFVLGKNDTFRENNLLVVTFTNLRLNFMAFYDSSMNLVHLEFVDLDKETALPPPSGLNQFLRNTKLLFKHRSPEDKKLGILSFPGKPLLASSWPITNNDAEEPIHGTLIIGRFLDQAIVKELAERTRLNLEIFNINATEQPSELREIRSIITPDSPIVIRNLNDDLVAGYAEVPDINGAPYLMLKITFPRIMTKQGRAVLRTFFFFMAAAGTIIVIILLILTQRIFLHPLGRLDRHVRKIQETKELNVRLEDVNGKDELGALAVAFNEMTASLYETQVVLEERERFIHSLVEGMSQCVFSKDLEGRFTYANKAFCSTLDKLPSDIMGKTDFDFYPPDLAVKYGEDDKKVAETGQRLELEEDYLLNGREWITVRTIKTPLQDSSGQLSGIIGIFWDITDQKRVEKERENLITELRSALAEVKILRGFLPICANCKKIRDDEGYWQQVESYVQDHSEAKFSHSICPECLKKLYPDLAEEVLDIVAREKPKKE